MPHFTPLRSIIALFLLIFSFNNSYSQKIKWQNIPDGKVPIPPNGVWLKDNLFIDATEMTNIGWSEYLFMLRTEDHLKSQYPYSDSLDWSALPDSLLYVYCSGYFLRQSTKEEIRRDYVYNGLFIRHHPVVGISYKQAMAYSDWRSMIVTELYNRILKRKGDTLRVMYRYRLPTEEEWELAAQASEPLPILSQLDKKNAKILQKTFDKEGFEDILWKDKYMPSFIYQYPIKHQIKNLDIFITGYNFLGDVRFGTSNNLGLRHIFGNVSEMTATEGIAKGGSWIHASEDCQIKSRQIYECPAEWLGFRNICEVYTYHKDSLCPISTSQEIVSEVKCDWIIEMERKENLKQDVELQKEFYLKNLYKNATYKTISLDSIENISRLDSILTFKINKDSKLYNDLEITFKVPDSLKSDTIIFMLSNYNNKVSYSKTFIPYLEIIKTSMSFDLNQKIVFFIIFFKNNFNEEESILAYKCIEVK